MTSICSACWVPDAKECFVLGKVVETEPGGTVTAETKGGARKAGCAYYPHDGDDTGMADLVQMSHVDTVSVLNCSSHAAARASTRSAKKASSIV